MKAPVRSLFFSRLLRSKSNFWLFLLLLLLFFVCSSIYLVENFPNPSAGKSSYYNLGFFILVNANVIAVMALGFLVIKNIIRLVFDRKRKIMGSKLRMRLVTAFVGLSLIPTILLFLVAQGILGNVLHQLFSPQISSAVDGSIEVARLHYDTAEKSLRRYVEHLSKNVSEFTPYILLEGQELPREDKQEILKKYFEEKIQEYGLHQIAIVDSRGEIIFSVSENSLDDLENSIPGPNLNVVSAVNQAGTIIRPENSLSREFIRGYTPLSFNKLGSFTAEVLSSIESETQGEDIVLGATEYVVVATVLIRPELSEILSGVVNAYDDFRETKSYKRPLASSYLLTLIAVTLLIVFSAIWVGFYLAKTLTGPIKQLADGTQAVAHGNLDYRINDVGDDEIGVLVKSFNKMTTDLKVTTNELVRRRRYMEAVFESVGVGILSIDPNSKILAINSAAKDILGVDDISSIGDKSLERVIPNPLSGSISSLLEKLIESSEQILTDNSHLLVNSEAKQVQITVTKLFSEKDALSGSVVLIEDITELVSAQRMSAWQEVAKRIAHEIKNPLTPIQLSAQRMQRRFRDDLNLGANEDRKLISDATGVIIKQVESLRTLVNEFSDFARMPKANLRLDDLNSIIEDTIKIYEESYQEVFLDVELDREVPPISLDREQIARVLINIIDNGIASIRSKNRDIEQDGSLGEAKKMAAQFIQHLVSKDKKVQGKIAIRTTYNKELSFVSLTISDDGEGVSDEDKSKLFEPYYSTKPSGTGLGLSIVKTIISDHQGFIRIKDVRGGGACFTIELPVDRAEITAVS